MIIYTYDELNKILKEHNCILLSTEEKYIHDSDVDFIDTKGYKYSQKLFVVLKRIKQKSTRSLA